jgi:hypothetical protein
MSKCDGCGCEVDPHIVVDGLCACKSCWTDFCVQFRNQNLLGDPGRGSIKVEWVVNDNAELGVKVGTECHFLYKGRSLVYEDGKHDNGTQIFIRPVGKREFGETCRPVIYDGKVSVSDSDKWIPMSQDHSMH